MFPHIIENSKLIRNLQKHMQISLNNKINSLIIKTSWPK